MTKLPLIVVSLGLSRSMLGALREDMLRNF